jgi:hypothetical protein
MNFQGVAHFQGVVDLRLTDPIRIGMNDQSLMNVRSFGLLQRTGA